MSVDLNHRLATLGLTLPAITIPLGSYLPAKRSGSLLFVAGQLPTREGMPLSVGAVPSRASVQQASLAARQCVINALGAVRASGFALESLAGVLRVGVFVASDPGFSQQPMVGNGASDLLVELFGDAGRHVRTSLGVSSLPLDSSVEVEFIFELAQS